MGCLSAIGAASEVEHGEGFALLDQAILVSRPVGESGDRVHGRFLALVFLDRGGAIVSNSAEFLVEKEREERGGGGAGGDGEEGGGESFHTLFINLL